MIPTPKLVQITAWSYSRYGTYTQCPFKAKLTCIDKMREPDSPAGLNGTRVHALAAAFLGRVMPEFDQTNLKLEQELQRIRKTLKPPVELNTFTEEFKGLRKLKTLLLVEQDWAFDREWQPTSWFGPQAWLRMKVDLHYLETKKYDTTIHIRDYKTGKKNPDHILQRSLYALGAFLQYPDAKRAVVAHWYLDQGVEDVQEWSSTELPKLKKEWLQRTKAMLSDSTFAPRPGEYCRWCWFSKVNGGPCVF